MAWHKETIEKFLERKLEDLEGKRLFESKEAVMAIRKRLKESLYRDNLITASALEDLMGDTGLAREFEHAWETDPSFHNFHS